MVKYIIFLDGEIKGYLSDELSAKKAVSELADTVIASLKETNRNIRIFRENIESGIKIYSQNIGTYIFNGFVAEQNTILWKPIEEYKL